MADYTKNLQRSDVLILYRTKYGTTKRYAQWIAEALNTEAIELAGFNVSRLEFCSILLFGSSVHVGKIKGIDFIKNNWEILRKKRIIVFASTGVSKIATEQVTVIETSLPANIRQNVIYFPLPGAYDYNKLDFADNFLMNFGPTRKLRFNAWFRGDKKAKEQLAYLRTKLDWTNREAITPIIQCIKKKHYGGGV